MKRLPQNHAVRCIPISWHYTGDTLSERALSSYDSMDRILGGHGLDYKAYEPVGSDTDGPRPVTIITTILGIENIDYVMLTRQSVVELSRSVLLSNEQLPS
jgi:hypothetical protein